MTLKKQKVGALFVLIVMEMVSENAEFNFFLLRFLAPFLILCSMTVQMN